MRKANLINLFEVNKMLREITYYQFFSYQISKPFLINPKTNSFTNFLIFTQTIVELTLSPAG